MEIRVPLFKLFVYSVVDVVDDFEEKYERAYQTFQQTTAGLSDKELHDRLSGLVSTEKQHEDISMALSYQILTDPSLAPKSYRDLTLLTRDGLKFISGNWSFLVGEKYHKLTDIARRQLLWLLRELVKNQVTHVENLLWNILRQASGGDVSQKNLALIEGVLDIMIEHRLWLERQPPLLRVVVYTYVRLLEDHRSPMLTALRNKEVKFIISLIRENFNHVLPLGRDFVRLLQNVAMIPEFEQLWNDILTNPSSLLSSFTGVWELLQIRTSRRYLQCRLTPDVERKLHFFATNVRFGAHKRYQDWFQDKYFTTPESHSLRSDSIRFIINAIHPTNDMLSSDLIPRWAIIGWLITSCTNPTALANAKLALFYDWLFFDPKKDNIMNIEPGILVMFHSIRNHPLVSSTLLDFLCRIMKNFFPQYESKIRKGVYNSLRKILEKQVIQNLAPLFDSPKLDRELRAMIRENFQEFCSISNPSDAHNQQPSITNPYHSLDDNRFNSQRITGDNDCRADSSNEVSDTDNEAKFSDDDDDRENCIKNDETDDDDDLPLSKVRLKEKPMPDKVDLPNSISSSFDKFITTKTSGTFDLFLTDLRTCSALDAEQETYVVENIHIVLKSSLPSASIFPESKTDKNDEKLLSASISYPLFSMFKLMYQYEEKLKKCVQSVLRQVIAKSNGVGYMLLYFLKVHTKLLARKNSSANVSFKSNLYKILCDHLDKKVETCLASDLALLESESPHIFLWILPDIFREFKSIVVNNGDVLRTLVGSVDAKGLKDLIYSVTQGKLTLFKNEGLLDCVRESLNYETFEQYCLWQLIQAHDVPFKYLQELLPDLESSSHHEALTTMLLMLKNEEPTTELIRLLLSRETKSRGDQFVTSSLRYWCQHFEENLSEIIANLLTSKYPNSSPNKRKRPPKSNSVQSSSPTSEQLLSHLEHFRRSCRHGNGTGTGLYVQDAMQRALQQSFSHSSDSTKKQYSDLFALAAEDDTSGVGRRGTSGRGRKPPASKKDFNSSNSNNKKNSEPINNYSSDEESSEDWTKPTPKRRKKALSDSD